MPLNNPSVALDPGILPTGAKAETIDRRTPLTGSVALVNGGLRLHAVKLRAGDVITSVTFLAFTTVPSGLTSLWGALYDKDLNLLAQSPNDPAPTWTESTFKTFTLTTPQTAAYTGVFYLGVCETGTTRNALAIVAGNAFANGAAPILVGASSSGLTTTAPAVAGAITPSSGPAYAYCS